MLVLVCKELSLIAQCKAKVTNRISGAIDSVLASIVIDRHYLRFFTASEYTCNYTIACLEEKQNISIL
jgi:hypothetical protein